MAVLFAESLTPLLVPIDSVTPYPGNPREGDVDALRRSLRRFGVVKPGVVQARTRQIVAGNHLWYALKEEGAAEFPASLVELSDEDARAYLIADNRVSDLGGYNEVDLAAILREIRMNDSLEGTGYSDLDVDKLLAQIDKDAEGGLTDPDEVPPTPEDPYVQPGDLWLMDGHRILCGDSTVAANATRLMGGEQARMCFTDPPWNVAYGTVTNPRWKDRQITNDDLPAAEFRALLDGFAAAMEPIVDGDVYCVMGAAEWPTIDASMREAGLHWSASIIWVKDRFTLGRSKYQRGYEAMWYGWPERGKSSFVGGRDLSDVWHFDRPGRSELHPTMKPVELVEQAIRNSSGEGAIVYEPFSGSGTTIIAAERLGRRCFAIEIEPAYVQVAIERWQNFTGRKAEKAEG